MDGLLQAVGAPLPEVLRLWLIVKPLLAAYLLGLAYLCLAVVQQCNSAIYRQARLAFVVSLMIGGCAFVQTSYVVRGDISQFLLFQLGCACGAALGIKLGHTIRFKVFSDPAAAGKSQ
jgi:hypothetical protein